MYYFELPDSPKTRQYNIALLSCVKEHPKWFFDDVIVDAVYGCPSSCIWNGGCINFSQEHLSNKAIKDVFEQYHELGVSYRLTFTNRLLTKSNLNDKFGNEILEIGAQYPISIIVSCDTMEDYIRSKYPQVGVIQSICRVYELDSQINSKSSNGLLCLPVRYNNQWDLLSKLQNRENLMVLVNEFCPETDCQYKKLHYESDNRFTLGQSSEVFKCLYYERGKQALINNESLAHHISPLNYKKYGELGITHFKINGRGRTGERLLSEYAKYLVKDEYKEQFQYHFLLSAEV